jgi:transposase-like protein
MLAERRPGGRLRGKRINDFERRQMLDLRSQDYSLDKIASEYGIAAVAREFGLSHEALRQWVRAWEERSK